MKKTIKLLILHIFIFSIIFLTSCKKEEIDSFQSEGHQVYNYINIGSIENFRDYYLNAYTNLVNSYSDVIICRYVVSKSNINWLIIG